MLIDAQGEPRSGAQVRDGMSARARPKNALAVGSVISRQRRKIGRDRVATGITGWWLTDPTEAPRAAHGAADDNPRRGHLRRADPALAEVGDERRIPMHVHCG
ncbi:hypothetical protein ACGF5C_22470 [Micromonospora sp. NPDC047620]|uniref:hypothetical protein n=1 Tax=Micromonospora sp. NPDC047620 TaxID=3364251 RepID=UPI00371C2E97